MSIMDMWKANAAMLAMLIVINLALFKYMPMFGIIVAAVALVLRNRNKVCEYDEMQLKIRAKGYQIGFFAALILMLCLVLLWETGLLTVVTPGFAIYAAMLISVTVFAIYCILHDAFLAINGKPNLYIGIFSAIVLLQGATTVRYLMEGEILEDGKLTLGAQTSAVVW